MFLHQCLLLQSKSRSSLCGNYILLYLSAVSTLHKVRRVHDISSKILGSKYNQYVEINESDKLNDSFIVHLIKLPLIWNGWVLEFVHTKQKRMRKQHRKQSGCIVFYATVHTKHQIKKSLSHSLDVNEALATSLKLVVPSYNVNAMPRLTPMLKLKRNRALKRSVLTIHHTIKAVPNSSVSLMCRSLGTEATCFVKYLTWVWEGFSENLQSRRVHLFL